MSREQKLALVLGFALVLIVGVLVSDHLSDASSAQVEHIMASPSSPTFGRGEAVESISPRLIEGAPLAQSDEATSLERIANGVHKAVVDRVDAIRDNPPPAAYETRAVPVLEMRLAPKPVVTGKPGRTYTIQSGDGLWSIADREYDNPQLYTSIANYNNIDLNSELQIGATLILPTIDMLTGSTPLAPPVATAPTAKPAQQPEQKTRRYTVVKGDVLGTVVQRELGTIKRMKEVLALNPKLDPDTVRIGDVIILPAR